MNPHAGGRSNCGRLNIVRRLGRYTVMKDQGVIFSILLKVADDRYLFYADFTDISTSERRNMKLEERRGVDPGQHALMFATRIVKTIGR